MMIRVSDHIRRDWEPWMPVSAIGVARSFCVSIGVPVRDGDWDDPSPANNTSYVPAYALFFYVLGDAVLTTAAIARIKRCIANPELGDAVFALLAIDAPVEEITALIDDAT